MENTLMDKVPLNDYSLVGRDSVLAVEKSLVDAKWYASPVPKQEMRKLLERRDGPAVRDTLIWFGLLFSFGFCGYLLWGTAWAAIPFVLYSVIYASTSDSRWHESGHGTAFKTDWMNNALYEIASFMVLRESTPWRWSHTRHHSDTIIVGRDPEIVVQRPVKLAGLIGNAFNLLAFRNYAKNTLLHSTGRLTPEERTYIPEAEYGKVFFKARLYLLIYAGVIGLSIYTGSLLPLMYIGLPNLYGAWLMVVYGYTQHAGLAENVLDHRLNSRTVYMHPIHRYLYWNMGYHLEHHMFPLVPYHALPKLHALIKSDTPPPYNGLIEAYREIIPALMRQRKDPSYYIKRPLPPPADRAALQGSAQAINGDGRPVVDGWIEVGSRDLLLKEDVVRFDHEKKTYAVYRTGEDRFYATEGLCTHGNAHLADGFVKGNLIECAKHNGRYDLRDGSPQRLPVCVGLKTYTVREQEGRLLLDLTSAGGWAVAHPAVAYRFRVASNAFVSAFVKELALELDPLSPRLDYQPGDYLQFDIPAYEERTLRDIEVPEPYAGLWEAGRIFDLRSGSPAPCRRNYSFASSPAEAGLLRFNVRLAAPPSGRDLKAGVGSSYLFRLRPGDAVTAIGPFGEFHVKNTERELVYLGGGSGMAPLRSHLIDLLETQKVTARVSYWYGARSRQELFYQETFQTLAKRYSNFTFHVALSEPRPEDGWSSHTGFIHEVLRREYLNQHPDPAQIEYFLCGPPVMIQAAVNMLQEFGVPPAQVHYDEF